MKKLVTLLAFLLIASHAFSSDLYDFYENYRTSGDFTQFSKDIDNHVDSEYFQFLLSQNQETEYTKNVLELQQLLHATANENSAENLLSIQDLILKSQAETISSLSKTEKLYQILIFTVSFFGIAFLFMLIFFINFKRRVSKLKLENEKENIAAVTLINVQEAERKRIYQDLHDTVVQNLRVNQMNLHKLEEKTADIISPENTKLLSLISKSETQSLEEIKTIINNLTPPELNGTDFRSSITNLCQNLSEASEIPCSIFIQKDVDFKKMSESFKLHIYRIIQESVTNAIKHAKASEISVIIKNTEKKLVIFITDDGIGMANGEKPDSGLGLKGIKSRVTYMNGTLKILSNPESGTELRVEIPY